MSDNFLDENEFQGFTRQQVKGDTSDLDQGALKPSADLFEIMTWMLELRPDTVLSAGAS